MPGGKAAFIGVHYNREPGDYTVRVTCGSVDVTQTVTVVHRDFPKQNMTIDQSVADATVNSAAANQEWKDVMFPLYASADAEIYWSGTFIRPCGTTAQNTQYGLYRYTNGSPYPERHAGIDYDCDLGDAVWAPGRGKVVYAGFLQMTATPLSSNTAAASKAISSTWIPLPASRGTSWKKNSLSGRRAARAIPQARTCTTRRASATRALTPTSFSTAAAGCTLPDKPPEQGDTGWNRTNP